MRTQYLEEKMKASSGDPNHYCIPITRFNHTQLRMSSVFSTPVHSYRIADVGVLLTEQIILVSLPGPL